MLGELYTTNKTYIALIPKKINSCKICDCRPISLVTSLYKIISKVLVSWLKNVLDSTISKTQGLLLPEDKYWMLLSLLMRWWRIIEQKLRKG